MLTVKVKLAVLLITSANIVLLPNLPQIELSIALPKPLLSSSFPSLSPSPLTVLTVINNSLYEECRPDISMILEKDPTHIQTSYKICSREIAASVDKTHPDTNKDTGEVIQAYGYPLEIHKVTTEDGYILTLHRIQKKGKTPVYLQHGLGGCSDNWILQYRNKSLAFLLADWDYDVWLANSRGTSYSLEHETLRWDDPLDYSYWDFSWHEIGVYDVPAITNYIISTTGFPKLVYIGHSMGTTTYFVALDQRPELNDKILAGILLAPAGFVSRATTPLRTIGQLVGANPNYLEPIMKGRMNFQQKNEILERFNKSMANICTPTAIRCTACDQFIFSLYGIDAPQMNYTNIPNNVAKFPNIVSVKTAAHFAQSLTYCSFRQYDYGLIKNMKIYNSSVPPDYTLKNVKAHTYTFYGDYDNLCRPKDVKRTLDLLPKGTLIKNFQVNSTYFNHIDFLLAKDALTLVYTTILTIMGDITLS